MIVGDRLKVLTINWTGAEGSTYKLIKDVEKYTSEECEYCHCYQVGAKGDNGNYLVASWNVTRFYYLLARIVGVKYGVGTLTTLPLLYYIKKSAPDVVHVHCPNFYNINLYMLFRYLKRKNYPVVITNHAEFFYTGNCSYAEECQGYLSGCRQCKRVFDRVHPFWVNRTHYEWKKMKEAFADADRFTMVVVSKWQRERIGTSPLTGNIKVKVIENAVNTDVFKKMDVQRTNLDGIRGFNGKIILTVTSDFSDDVESLKGGSYFINLAKRMPEYLFVAAGNVRLSEGCKLSDNLILLGNVTDQIKLAEYYNAADLTVLTSRRETFGMACAESLSCGTPVVGFQAGGTETISSPQYSEFVEYGDMDALEDVVRRWFDKKAAISDRMAEESSARYAARRMAMEYMELYRSYF